MENKRHKEIQQDYGDTRLNRASHFVESYVKKKKKIVTSHAIIVTSPAVE